MATAPEMTEPSVIATRNLTEAEIARLAKDQMLVSEFKQNKLEKEAEKNWDLFYKRNTTKFFKDRHWTKREFEELVGNDNSEEKKVLFEVGCGVGNFMFPLLEEDHSKSLFIYACDFSKRAVQFVKEHSSYDADHCHAFHADVTVGFGDNVPDGSVDMATLIFVLSAIHPDKMEPTLTNILQTLKPGGVLLFRDYGLYDYAMLRFAPGHKLADNFYVRQDGTRAFYFSIECLTDLVKKAGYEVLECQYVHRETINKKEGLCVPRIFVQAKFQRPCKGSESPGDGCSPSYTLSSEKGSSLHEISKSSGDSLPCTTFSSGNNSPFAPHAAGDEKLLPTKNEWTSENNPQSDRCRHSLDTRDDLSSTSTDHGLTLPDSSDLSTQDTKLTNKMNNLCVSETNQTCS